MSLQQHDNTGDGGTPIRDAACLILADMTGSEPRLLLGRRPATQVFLPNMWVFPGGRVDDDDQTAAALLADAADIPNLPRDLARFACAAVRETFEETGILIADGSAPLTGALPPAWRHFADLGGLPGISTLKPVARAITPPGFPRRFDTWFYFAEWRAGQGVRGTPDGELLDLAWFTVAEVRALDLAIITRLIVDDVAMLLAAGGAAAAVDIPFYFQGVDRYERTLLTAPEVVASP